LPEHFDEPMSVAFEDPEEDFMAGEQGQTNSPLNGIRECGPTTHRAALTDNASRDNLLSEPTAHREDW